MRVNLADGSDVDCEDEPIGEGAGGTVYRVRKSAHVVKLFKNPTQELCVAMEKVVGEYNSVASEAHWKQLLCWPDALVVSPSLGIRMPAYPGTFRELTWFLSPKIYRLLKPAEKSWNSRLLMALRLSRAVARLHRTGLAHSDLSPNNICVDPQDGRVTIIDLDGLVVPGVLPPQVMGTPGYIAPEVLARGGSASAQTDLHALAVLIYQLLLYAHPLKGPKQFAQDPYDDEHLRLGPGGVYVDHPTDRSNRPTKTFWPARILGVTMDGLFKRAFVDGLKDPAARPTAGQWESAIARMSDRVLTCANPQCDERYFPATDGVPLVCPWCKHRLSVPRGTPALRLYRGDHRGQFDPEAEWWIAGLPGRTLHRWHVTTGVDPGPPVDPTPLAQVEHDRGSWLLRNLALDTLRPVRDGVPAAPLKVGEHVALTEGTVLLLGPPPRCRAVFVQVFPSR